MSRTGTRKTLAERRLSFSTCRLIRKHRPNLTTIRSFGLCASVLCAPLAWADYLLMLAPAFVARQWHRLDNAALTEARYDFNDKVGVNYWLFSPEIPGSTSRNYPD
jgi:hypothetical protein